MKLQPAENGTSMKAGLDEGSFRKAHGRLGRKMVLLAMATGTCVSGMQGAEVKSAQENLALGKHYVLEPAPNYRHCTDPDDDKQLTDGQYSAGYFWTQPSTVGWSGARPVVITIDLGQVQPIRGVSYNTAAGVAGVEWPQSITILVSDDGQRYFVAGELASLSARQATPPHEGYAVHRFRTDELKTHGRYVQLLVAPSGPFCFVDEVEVFKGQPGWLEFAHEGEAISDAKTFFKSEEKRLAIERRIRDDARAVREAADKADIALEIKREITAELDAVAHALPNLPKKQEPDFRAILPLNEVHARVFRTQAKLWQAQGSMPFTVWQSGLWDPLLPTAPIPADAIARGSSGRVLAKVNVAMMQNEYRAGAFNISFTGGHALAVRMQIVGLPGGANPAYASVREVAWTDTKTGQPVAAALPEARRVAGGFALNVLPGLTRQVWLTFHPTDVSPGIYQGSIILSADDTTLQVPVSLRIFPLRFPDTPTLHVGGWDYTDVDAQYEITPQNREAVLAHLREHFVDSPWATSGVLAHGKYGPDGSPTNEPDTAQFDRWLQRWPNARQYCVFAAVGNSLDNSPMRTPAFDKKVGAWIRFWARHAERRALKPPQLVVLLVDEPSEAQQDEIILAWAQAIHAAGTGVKVWEDPMHADPAAANQEMMRACDVLCPNRVSFLQAKTDYRNYYANRREEGAELAFYSCSGPVRSLDPYAYHRLQAWSCWQHGARASYFWAFGDSGGGSSWNEYAARGAAYVPFFLDATSVTAGKHMEALREGVEDFEYLVMLRNRIAECERAGFKHEALERARQLLTEAPERVCNAPGTTGFMWAQEKNRTATDEVRVAILEALSALR